ncbi:MAG: ADP-ribosylglycohydrolase family protein [Flavobacteriaceae bacterium]|nr:ADP-ribosylglycohydrolase family protein [Flavobacteriaceae bacterium]
MKTALKDIQAALFGQAIGDALGVPVEFTSRSSLQANPVTDYRAFGCWNQPAGTFSDDSSMLFCTVESLLHGYHLEDMANRFVQWYTEGYWGAHHKVFDIGGTTRRSLDRIQQGESPLYSGEWEEENNGNGSLMRILPLVFYLRHMPEIDKRFAIVKAVSSITHAHFRSVMSCFIFVEFGISICQYPKDLQTAYRHMQQKVQAYAAQQGFNQKEMHHFARILHANMANVPIDQLSSEGYVLDSLESAIWCLLSAKDYRESALMAVNLGGDTDTTAAINGGLAGLHFGWDAIPQAWVQQLARSSDILDLAKKFHYALSKQT